MTICPCCGFKFHGALSSGCKQCGARAVGEPLPKPARELPSYGRALVLAVSGSLVVLVFVTQTLIAFFQRSLRQFRVLELGRGRRNCGVALEVGFDPAPLRDSLGRTQALPVHTAPAHAILWSQIRAARSARVVRRYAPDRAADRHYRPRAHGTTPALKRSRRYVHRATLLSLRLTQYKVKYKTYPADLKIFARSHS